MAATRRSWVLAVILSLFTAAPAAATTSAGLAGVDALRVLLTTGQEITDGPDPAGADQLLALANRERANAGLVPLTNRLDIVAVATDHSAAMASRGEIYHNDTYFSPATKSRLALSAVGENVGQAGSIPRVHSALMNSAPHRANILNGTYRVVGVAVVWASGQLFITEDFGVPKGGSVTKPAAPTTTAAATRPPTTLRPVTATAPRPTPPPTTTTTTSTVAPATTTTTAPPPTTTAAAALDPPQAARPLPVRSARAGPAPVLVFTALLILVLAAIGIRRTHRRARP